jgi:FAD/FMN-containing dehydrogenase
MPGGARARAGRRGQGPAQRRAQAARLFFAPELSTSNRATIGGMVSTDASGQGSCTYGKTRDHVHALDTVLLGGERFTSMAVDEAEARAAAGAARPPGRCLALRAPALRARRRALIEERFP